jgi:hypothetical protein
MSLRIDPQDIELLRALRRLVPGGSYRETPKGVAGPVISPQRAQLGRVIDVAWSFNVVGINQFQQEVQLGDPNLLKPQKFGRVDWQAEVVGQLAEEDWCIQVQPLDILEYEGALPRLFVSTEGVSPFIAPLAPPFPPGQPNPAAWWPTSTSEVDVLGSPWWLVVTAGPEEGATQRWPIPAVGLSVAVRGRNITASIEYNPLFAANGIVFLPLEAPIRTQGRGRMLLTATKASPVPRQVVDQMTRGRIRIPGGTIVDAVGLVWIPKFATSIQTLSNTGGAGQYSWLDQTGAFLAIPDNAFGRTAIPHEAVALTRQPGDYTKTRYPVVFEVFA